MQHTTKYNFNLIETSDAFSPEALNTNTKEMEKVLTALETTHTADKAELEAADAADKAELQTAIQKAQTAADAAQSTADAARAEAAVLPYVVGSYRGNSSTMEFNLGFRPSCIFINGDEERTNANIRDQELRYSGFVTPEVNFSQVTFTDTGFTVKYIGGLYANLNSSSRSYRYIAFR